MTITILSVYFRNIIAYFYCVRTNIRRLIQYFHLIDSSELVKHCVTIHALHIYFSKTYRNIIKYMQYMYNFSLKNIVVYVYNVYMYSYIDKYNP